MTEPFEPWVLVFCIFNWFIMKINQVKKNHSSVFTLKWFYTIRMFW